MLKKSFLLLAATVAVYICFSYDKKVPEKRKLSDNTPIAKVKGFTGDIDSSGFRKGREAVDITLYSKDGKPVTIKELLADKKPVLLVGGSYTCPFFRHHVPDLEQIAAVYKDKLNIYIVYQIEAHPTDVAGPLSDKIDLAMENVIQELEYKQPKTFGQRKAMTDTLVAKMGVKTTILIDGPNNDFWKLYGPAPNDAYLIDTNLVIRGKNVWLNEAPENIWCDVDRLLNMSSGRCR
ncbi:MAG: hypothetical protein JSS82_07485 [Bacteroidetes bacterium]|nr:hypothetical protein [Bacteroidota bacterium]